MLADSYKKMYESSNDLKFFKYGTHYPHNRNEALAFLAESGERVLEIGCGNGNVLFNLKDRYHHLHGVELSESRAKLLQAATHQIGANFNIISGNIEEGLPFQDGYFDTILWADVIEHIVDLWRAMIEINRLLKVGGTLITCTPNIAELRRRLTLLLGYFPSTSGSGEGFDGLSPNDLYDGGHLHYFTFSSLTKLYLKYNIEPIRRLGYGRLGPLHNIHPPLLSASIALVGIKKGEFKS